MAEELYTVQEVAKILKVNINYVYDLRNHGLLTFMKLGSLKCRKTTLENFLEKYDGYDFSDMSNVKPLMEVSA